MKTLISMMDKNLITQKLSWKGLPSIKTSSEGAFTVFINFPMLTDNIHVHVKTNLRQDFSNFC